MSQEERSSAMKVCPDCACEYHPHIEQCVDCGVSLISREESVRRQEERRRLMEMPLETPVVIREGDVKWMGELHEMLIASGYSCRMHSDPGCQKGCGGNTCQLLVSHRDAEGAHERIEEYFAEVHPEVRASQELISEGKCPACGSSVDSAAAECPDCGLTLFVVE
jgi:hypothetical protein